MAEQKCKKNRRKGGFTTVELIVVIVLLMILASGLIFGIVKWVEWTNFKQQNEYARTIFVAAQNQLTEYSESGKLEEIAAKLKNEKGEYPHTVNVNTLTDSEGTPYPEDILTALEKVWPESAGKTNGSVYRDTICYINVTADDYQAYLNGTATKEATVFYDMVSEYLYDMSILNASVCIEFTPEEGQVFSVLYSDRAEKFEYNKDNSNTKGTVDISDRSTSYRKARMVGYYGVDTLYKATTVKAEKPSITKVRLNNEETLNLSFAPGKIPAAITQMTYEIQIRDKSSQKILFVAYLDGTKIKNDDSKSKGWVPCDVVRYNYEGDTISQQDMGKYYILAWIDDDQTVRVVFDAADLNANTRLYQQAYPDLIKTEANISGNTNPALKTLLLTNSFRRFGVDATDIYCTIQGSGAGFKATARKQSNAENAYYGSMQTETVNGETTVSYTLRNARHLYNIRYEEDCADSLAILAAGDENKENQHVTWLLDADTDWRTFAASDNLMKGQEFANEKNPHEDFPSIKQLRINSVFESTGRKEHVISGLTVTYETNKNSGLYVTESSSPSKLEGSVGLFLKNSGTIENVILDAVTVSGKKNVGAFCGINEGRLKGLTVEDSDEEQPSSVTGEENVGGIAGGLDLEGAQTLSGTSSKAADEKTPDIRMDNLMNRARVTGITYVGGIVGSVKITNEIDGNIAVRIENCTNYGQIGVPETVYANKAQYIGGITGYAGVDGGSTQNRWIELTGCASSPQYSSDEIDDILQSKATIYTRMKGIYVGGIVGYNEYGNITNCNTEKENRTSEGYIFGYQYVGGIVGYNEGTSNGQASLNGAYKGTKSVNAVHVLGESYVGGIVGCNGGLNQYDEPDKTPVNGYKVTGWINQGIVLASGKSNYGYAGGIAGYNSGIIEECECDVANTDAVMNLAKTESLWGDYVGGIAGYNSGKILSSSKKPISVVCYVSGNNFLGGIAGYNDVEGIIDNYAVAGGYIIGKGCFVGGYAGINTSGDLLKDKPLESNPNVVRGTYCVGGTLGANIAVATKGEDITAYFKTDNFLGVLEAEAFAGGFIGYNMLVENQKDVDSSILLLIKDFMKRYDLYKNYDLEVRLKDAVNFFDRREVDYVTKSSSTLTISSSGSNSTQSRFGGIKAQIYVGGVIGYNDVNTRLTIENVTNLTPVTAHYAIINPSEQTRNTYDNKAFTYSYVGGIIGKVTKYTTLKNCGNRDVGDVSSVGTYLGGLCEINEGTIIDCTVSSIGTNDKDYVGGIAGLNKEGGVIQGTIFKNRTVTGRNYVGGVAAENFGRILDTTLETSNITAVSNVGGIAAYSAQNAEIQAGLTNDVYITATGENVGGIVGYNVGELSQYVADNTQNASSGTEDMPEKSLITGSISGGWNVGGVIGYNDQGESGKVINFRNEASIIAEGQSSVSSVDDTTENSLKNGEETLEPSAAGGIIGFSTKGTIRNCENSGTVTSTKSGNAGGIIGSNAGTIETCTNTAVITAPNGMAGGITGVNTGEIISCSVAADNLTFTGKTHVGGICGYNRGNGAKISNSFVVGVTLTNLSQGSDGSMLGGITGQNDGEITDCQAGEEKKNLVLLSNAVDVSVGGLAGINSGSIKGSSDNYSKIYAELSFIQQSQAYYGNIGGVAGSNTGKIQYCEFNGNVTGTGNNPQLSPEYNPNTDFETNGSIIYGYGGIAGVNGSSDSDVSGEISDCKVNVAQIIGLGDPNNVANIGGVAGVNGLGGKISAIYFGNEAKYPSLMKDDKKNLPEVQNVSASVYVGTGTSTNAYAHSGGVAGLNSGSITNIYTQPSTEKENTYTFDPEVDESCVLLENYRGHVGGIVGYNRRSGIITNVATGKTWVVFAPDNAQDNGCGGIVGYQAFDNTMSYCINRAAVEKITGSSNGVGGLIGRMETANGSNFTISYCTNYGTVKGNNRVGGMIGVWKYYGGLISDCINYGSVTSNGSQGSGGMVGNLYSMKTTAANFVRCENHGKITGSNSGGIAGSGTHGPTRVKLQKCVNTGLIQVGQNCGGIVGAMDSEKGSSTIIACSNYGYGFNNNARSLNGIASSQTDISIKDCLGIADTDYPITSRENADVINSYYLANADGMEVQKEYFYVKQIQATGIETPEGLKYLFMQDSADGLSKDDKRAFFRSNVKNKEYVFTFNRAINLQSIDIYLWKDDNNRKAKYRLEYCEDDDGNWKPLDWNSADYETEGILSLIRATRFEGNAVKALKIKVIVTECKSDAGKGSDANCAIARAHFSGSMAVGNTEVVECSSGPDGYTVVNVSNGNKINYEDYMTDFFNTDIAASKRIVIYNGPDAISPAAFAAAEQENRGKGSVALVADATDSSGYMLYVLKDETVTTLGIPGFPENPLIAFDTNKVGADNSLTALGDKKDNIRYQVFKADDPYFDANKIGEITSLTAPTDIKFTDNKSASYKVKWNEVSGAAYYYYEAVFMNGDNILETRTGTIYDNSVILSVEDINGSAVTKIIFKVRAGARTLGDKDMLSDYSEESQDILPLLPAPQYHLELEAVPDNTVDSKMKLKYRTYLDNKDEYINFFRNQGMDDNQIKTALGKLKICVLIGGTVNKNLSMDAATAKSEKATYSGSNTNVVFSAYAEYGEKTEKALYTVSARPMRESQAYEHSLYTNKDKKIANVSLERNTASSIGFMGVTAATLSYQLKINSEGPNDNDKYIVYMRSEMIATDVSLGIPVAVSTSQLRTSNTNTAPVPTSLSGLPANLLDNGAYTNLMVRSYPALMSNNIVYTGHTVDISGLKEENAIGISKDKLTELYVTYDNGVTFTPTDFRLIEQDANGNTKLADGFVVELAADGTYTLYYNTLLSYNEKVDWGEDGPYPGTTGMRTQVFYHYLDENRDTMPKPEIVTNADSEGYINDDQLTITWDKGNAFDKTAVYDYTITGYLTDGSSAQIDAGVWQSADVAENSLSYDASAWTYKTVTISISRRGTQKNGMTEKFPSGSIIECKFKLRFTQLTRPDISLHKVVDPITGNETVQKNSLLYDVTWRNLPESERLPEGNSSKSEVGAYQITVEPTASDTAATVSYNNLADYEAALVRVKTLYSGKNGVQISENDDGSTTYQWTEENISENWQVEKTMVVSGLSETDHWSITKKLTAVWTFTADSTMLGEVSLTRMLDLNDYGRGENIAVSVQAIVKEDAKTYRNGAKGVVRELTLPSRLDVPTVTQMTIEPIYNVNSFMTLEEYASGVTLKMTAADEGGILQGRYELAVAVYDSMGQEDLSKVARTGDGDGASEGFWNDGALETLISKASQTTMDGNLISANYVQQLSADYAGKWLKIAMRSISDSNVSSEWSDEDEDGATVNYVWLQIPRVRLQEPELLQGTKLLYYDEDGNWNGGFTGSGLDAAIKQTGLSFDLIENAHGYEIVMIRNGEQDETIGVQNYTVKYMDWIYLEALNGGYDVYYLTTDPEIKMERTPEKLSNINPKAYYVGHIAASAGDSGYLRLPYTGRIAESAYEGATEDITVALVQVTDDGRVNMVLPDVEEINNTPVGNDGIFTAQMSVRAMAVDSNQSLRYADSQVTDWYRLNDNRTHTIIMDDYEPAPQAAISVEASDLKDIAFEIKASSGSNWLVYEIEVTDGGAVIWQDYLSTYGYGTTTIDTRALLPDIDYAQFSGKNLHLRVAAIVDGEDGNGICRGGLSQWSSSVDITLPGLTLEAPTVAEELTAAINGSIAVNDMPEEVVLGGIKYSWTQDMSAEGYEISVGGQNITINASDYSVGQTEVNLPLEAYYEETVQVAPVAETDQTNMPDASPQTGDTAETNMSDANLQTANTVNDTNGVATETMRYRLSTQATLKIEVSENGVINYTLTVPNKQSTSALSGGKQLTFTFPSNEDDSYVKIVPVKPGYSGSAFTK